VCGIGPEPISAVHGGIGWGDASYAFPAFFFANTAYQPVGGGSFTNGMNGGAIGYHSGFNVQSGNLVVGVEAAYTWTGLKSSTTNAFPAAVVTPGATYSAKINWLTTITPRLGYAAGPWLLYVKGGLAGGEVDSTMTGALVPTIQVQEKNRQLGWTAGAGIEYAMWERWVLGLEYNYYDLGSERFGGSARQAGVPTDYGDYNVGVKASSVLARLSYRGGILETVLSAGRSAPTATPTWN
jgi:outer membrane immunogenic protein